MNVPTRERKDGFGDGDGEGPDIVSPAILEGGRG